MQKNYRNDSGRRCGGEGKSTSKHEFATKSHCKGCKDLGNVGRGSDEAPFTIIEEEIIPGLGPIAGYRPVIVPK